MEKRILTLPCSLYRKQATIYPASVPDVKAAILYLHGGGLLYGAREDLPEQHLQLLTSAGCTVIALDYPLAPAAKLPEILADVEASLKAFLMHPERFGCEPLPYFLWGRSSGAYLWLTAAARLWGTPDSKGEPLRPPAGILSYYGYGFLCDGWFTEPSPYYLSFPAVDRRCLEALPPEIHAEGSLETHYSVYVYARQTGKWLSLLYTGREKYFYRDYTLRLCGKLPCPLFAAHSTADPDVPFSEYLELTGRYPARTFLAAVPEHDFDRHPESPAAEKLLEETLGFLNARTRECSS